MVFYIKWTLRWITVSSIVRPLFSFGNWQLRVANIYKNNVYLYVFTFYRCWQAKIILRRSPKHTAGNCVSWFHHHHQVTNSTLWVLIKGTQLIFIPCDQSFCKGKALFTLHKELPDFDHQVSERGSLSGVVGPAAGHKWVESRRAVFWFGEPDALL